MSEIHNILIVMIEFTAIAFILTWQRIYFANKDIKNLREKIIKLEDKLIDNKIW